MPKSPPQFDETMPPVSTFLVDRLKRLPAAAPLPVDGPGRSELLEACRVLFGHEFAPSFLGQLQETGLKSAWRLKACQTHPDRSVDPAAEQRHVEGFIEARPRPPGTTPQRPGNHRAAAIPRRRLRLGEYLYHAQAIPFSAIIEAPVWQRRRRDRFCEVARRWGYLSDTETRRLLSKRRPHEQVGTTALRLQLLTAFQVRTVLAFQQSRQQPFGSYFVSRGYLSPIVLRALLERLDRHNAAFSRG